MRKLSALPTFWKQCNDFSSRPRLKRSKRECKRCTKGGDSRSHVAYNHNITGGGTHLTLPCTSGQLMSHLNWTSDVSVRNPISLHVIYDGHTVFMMNTLASTVRFDETYMEMRNCKLEGRNRPFAATFSGVHNHFDGQGRNAFRNNQSPVHLYCDGTNDPILILSGVEIPGEEGFKAHVLINGELSIPRMDVLYELRMPYNTLRRAVRDENVDFFVSFRGYRDLAFHEASTENGHLVEVQPKLKGMSLYSNGDLLDVHYLAGWNTIMSETTREALKPAEYYSATNHVQLHQHFVMKRLRRAGVMKNDLVSIGIAALRCGGVSTLFHYIGLNQKDWSTRAFFNRTPLKRTPLVEATFRAPKFRDPEERKVRRVFIAPPKYETYSEKVRGRHEIWSPRTEPGFIWEEPEMNERDKEMVREWFTAYLNAEAKKGEQISPEHKEAFQRLTS